MSFIPISPILNPKGAFVALISEFGEEKSIPVSLKNESGVLANFLNFDIESSSISTTVAAKMNLGNFFSGSFDFKDRAFHYDAIVYNDEYEEGNLDDKIILATRWGIGIRLVFKVTNIKSEFNFNIRTLSAASELGIANVDYKIEGLGLGIEGFNIAVSEIANEGPFNIGSLDKITNILMPKLAKYIQKNKATLKPQPIGVKLAKSISLNYLEIGTSVLYGLKSISKEKSLKEALNRRGPEFEEDIVEYVYETVVGQIPQSDKPSDMAKNRAKNILKSIN